MLKIYDLKAARRYLRQVQVSTHKRDGALKIGLKNKDVRQTGQTLGHFSEHLKNAQSDLDIIRMILTALHGPLLDPENTYMQRILDHAVRIEGRIVDHINYIDNQLGALTTRYESKLNVLLIDLQKRFEKQYNTRFLIRRIEDRDVGVLSLEKNKSYAFCVLLSDPMDLDDKQAIKKIGQNFFKVFFNNIPADLSFDNFAPFESPSRVAGVISDLLREEGY